MIIREIYARNILSKSRVFDYAINPYIGCQYGCTHCYARFMKRLTRYKEPWGEFVDVKINAPDLLKQEIIKKHLSTETLTRCREISLMATAKWLAFWLRIPVTNSKGFDSRSKQAGEQT